MAPPEPLPCRFHRLGDRFFPAFGRKLASLATLGDCKEDIISCSYSPTLAYSRHSVFRRNTMLKASLLSQLSANDLKRLSQAKKLAERLDQIKDELKKLRAETRAKEKETATLDHRIKRLLKGSKRRRRRKKLKKARRKLSEAARKRIVAAQKKRWAKVRANKKSKEKAAASS